MAAARSGVRYRFCSIARVRSAYCSSDSPSRRQSDSGNSIAAMVVASSVRRSYASAHGDKGQSGDLLSTIGILCGDLRSICALLPHSMQHGCQNL